MRNRERRYHQYKKQKRYYAYIRKTIQMMDERGIKVAIMDMDCKKTLILRPESYSVNSVSDDRDKMHIGKWRLKMNCNTDNLLINN